MYEQIRTSVYYVYRTQKSWHWFCRFLWHSARNEMDLFNSSQGSHKSSSSSYTLFRKKFEQKLKFSFYSTL